MLPFFAWKIFSISFFISLDFYLQVFLVAVIELLPQPAETDGFPLFDAIIIPCLSQSAQFFCCIIFFVLSLSLSAVSLF